MRIFDSFEFIIHTVCPIWLDSIWSWTNDQYNFWVDTQVDVQISCDAKLTVSQFLECSDYFKASVKTVKIPPKFRFSKSFSSSSALIPRVFQFLQKFQFIEGFNSLVHPMLWIFQYSNFLLSFNSSSFSYLFIHPVLCFLEYFNFFKGFNSSSVSIPLIPPVLWILQSDNSSKF